MSQMLDAGCRPQGLKEELQKEIVTIEEWTSRWYLTVQAVHRHEDIVKQRQLPSLSSFLKSRHWRIRGIEFRYP